MSITLDRREFARLANELRRVKKFSSHEMLTYMGKILVHYLLRATPPFGKHPFRENWGEQKKIGIASIKRDWGKLFVRFDADAIRTLTGKENPRAARYLARYAREGSIGKANTVLRGLGLAGRAEIALAANPESITQNYREAIGFRSRPHKIFKRFYVIQWSSVRRAMARIIRHVGKAKSGWNRAASRLAFTRYPAWIKTHGTFGGTLIDDRRNNVLPSLTMVNDVKGARAVDVDVVNAAMQELLRSGIRAQLRHIFQKQARRLNGGTAPRLTHG